MFKPLKKIVINSDAELEVLLEQPNVYPSVPFVGWTAPTDKVRISPFADPFTAGNIVAVRRTIVTGSSAVLSAGNYSTPVVTTPVAPINANAILTSTNVRRASAQTATLTINATNLPTAGALCHVKTIFRTIDRERVEFNWGHKVLATNFKVSTAPTTTTVAQQIRFKLLELFAQNGELKGVTITGAANVLTITGFPVGIEFEMFTADTEHLEYTPINSTFAVTIPAFGGMLDYYNMRAYVQSASGMFNLIDGSTDFLPIKGALYDAYFIKYRVNNPEGGWIEHQAGTINAEQSHIVDMEIYVKQGTDTTVLRTALNEIAGF